MTLCEIPHFLACVYHGDSKFNPSWNILCCYPVISNFSITAQLTVNVVSFRLHFRSFGLCCFRHCVLFLHFWSRPWNSFISKSIDWQNGSNLQHKKGTCLALSSKGRNCRYCRNSKNSESAADRSSHHRFACHLRWGDGERWRQEGSLYPSSTDSRRI